MNIEKIKQLYLSKMNYLTKELSIELEVVNAKKNNPVRLLGKKDNKFQEDNAVLNEISDINFTLLNDSNQILLEQFHMLLMTDKEKEFNESFYQNHLNILKKIDVKIEIIKQNILKQQSVLGTI